MTVKNEAALKVYDSPMVENYYWYPTASKIPGYHKYTVSNPNIAVFYKNTNNKWVTTGDSVTHKSTTLSYIPYEKDSLSNQDKSVKTDFYVTYTVKPEYAHLYGGAATEDAIHPSSFLVKQGDYYAKINGSNQLTTTNEEPSDLETIGEDIQWYVKPNFNIDKEMGYNYSGEYDEKTKDETEEEYVEAGKNGFDPYNVQIQSVANEYYYFTAGTTGSQLSGGAWTGSGTGLTLENLSDNRQPGIQGHDQTALKITNATFMVISDGNGHMRLMPRFDNTKVVSTLTGATPLTPLASASNYLTLTLTPQVVHLGSDLAVKGGHYILAEDFKFNAEGFTFSSLGTEEDPFTGSIDGRYHTFTGLSVPLLEYADGAIIKNIILNDVDISPEGNAGAIAANATGETRIYNCGILSGSVGGSEDVGGIVGSLDGKARVINCYSYADVSGGTNVGGIVGNNKGTTTAASINTMVMNCIFYGDITSGTNKSPVYGGNIIDNRPDGLNNYNYYAYKKLPTANITNYNCALAVEDKYLNRFEFYRLLLNSNKKLAAYYASSPEETVSANDMMKWVLETADRSIETEDAKPYPILKKRFNDDGTTARYPSIINYDVENAPDSASVGRYNGGKLGKS